MLRGIEPGQRTSRAAVCLVWLMLVVTSRALTPAGRIPGRVQELAEPDETAMHWLDVNVCDAEGSDSRCAIYLFMGTELASAASQIPWFSEDLLLQHFPGTTVVDPDGVILTDPELVARSFAAALNSCYLKQCYVYGERLRHLNEQLIDPGYLQGVLDSLDNWVISFENLLARLQRIHRDGDADVFRDAFMQILSRSVQARLSSGALLVALGKTGEAEQLASAVKDTPGMMFSTLLYEQFIEEQELGKAAAEHMARVRELHDPDWQLRLEIVGGAQKTIEVAEFLNSIAAAYFEKRALDVDSPSLRQSALLLAGADQAMETGLVDALADSRTATERLLEAVVTAEVKFLLGKGTGWVTDRAVDAFGVALDKVCAILGKEGISAASSRFIFATGTGVGLAQAREAFNTESLARSMRICAASAQIEETARQTYASALGPVRNWDRFAPPSSVQRESLTWLHRLHILAAANFHSVLGIALGSEENLITGLKQLGYDFTNREWTWSPTYETQAENLLDHARTLEQNANYTVPDSTDCQQDLTHLMHVYRMRPATDQALYAVVDLGSLPKAWHRPDINERGQALAGGNLWSAGSKRSVRAGGVSDFDPCALNDRGHVCGDAFGGRKPTRLARGTYYLKTPYLCTGGQAQAVDMLAGANTGYARDVNATGHVVGQCGRNANPRQPFPSAWRAYIWRNGRATDLGSLGGQNSFANALNASDVVVGMSETRNAVRHAFAWRQGVISDLGALGGKGSEATDISDSGWIVGGADTDTGATHAFLFEGQTMRDLGTLGGNTSKAYGVNNEGQIVGESAAPGLGTRAFLWCENEMQDINSLLDNDATDWTLESASAINDDGEIVGLGKRGGQLHFFLAQPRTASRRSSPRAVTQDSDTDSREQDSRPKAQVKWAD